MNRTPASAKRLASRHCLPKSSVGFCADSIQVQRGLGFALDVDKLRHFRLHPKGELERLDDALDLPVGVEPVQVRAVHLLDQVELAALDFGLC